MQDEKSFVKDWKRYTNDKNNNIKKKSSDCGGINLGSVNPKPCSLSTVKKAKVSKAIYGQFRQPGKRNQIKV